MTWNDAWTVMTFDDFDIVAWEGHYFSSLLPMIATSKI